MRLIIGTGRSQPSGGTPSGAAAARSNRLRAQKARKWTGSACSCAGRGVRHQIRGRVCGAFSETNRPSRFEGAAMATSTVKVVGPRDGKAGFLGSIGVRFMIDGGEAGERFSLVEHPMPARALAAPLHRHNREDEYSYILEGRMGALLGDEVVVAQAGDLVFKPRGQWHTFWNAGDEPARILEIISPAGFEKFFQELVDMGGVTQVEPETLAKLCARYELDMQPET